MVACGCFVSPASPCFCTGPGFCRRHRNQQPGQRLLISHLECGRIFGPVSYCDHARIYLTLWLAVRSAAWLTASSSGLWAASLTSIQLPAAPGRFSLEHRGCISLVNVVLVPLLWAAQRFGESAGWQASMPDLYALAMALWWINLGLLVFNLLPIYPLDGGQILRSLLWFPLGRARSLMAATVIGFIGAAGLIALAVRSQSVWFAFLSIFILSNCWTGWKGARAMSLRDKLPKRQGFACPSCKTSLPIGAFWGCSQCGHHFDTFETGAVCPTRSRTPLRPASIAAASTPSTSGNPAPWSSPSHLWPNRRLRPDLGGRAAVETEVGELRHCLRHRRMLH